MAVTFKLDQKGAKQWFGYLGNQAQALAETLMNKGCVLNVGFAEITLTDPAGKILSKHPLAINSTAVAKGMKGTPISAKHQVITGVESWLQTWVTSVVDAGGAKSMQDHLTQEAKAATATEPELEKQLQKQIKALSSTGKGNVAAFLKQIAPDLPVFQQAPTVKLAEPPNKYAPPGAKVVPLKDATMLGQPVKGTSGGSVYRTVAIGERVKLAVNWVKGTKLAVRAEGQMTPKERQAFVAMGFQDQGTHLSNHFGLSDGTPPERILGCLFFHPELTFHSKVENMGVISASF